MTRRFWICAAMTTLSALTSVVTVMQQIIASGEDSGSDFYALSRSIALIIATLGCVLSGSREALIGVAFIACLVEAFDGIIGALAHEPGHTYVPFAFAVLNVAALFLLIKDRKA
jgi:hypothetical protein